MKEREWTSIDKSGWAPGPWQSEPDKAQWEDEETRLPCLVKRNSALGILCGYVGVSEDHPYFERDFGDLWEQKDCPDVHGGLTYSSFCQEGDEAKTICHVVEPGENDRVWWLGFDCGHAWDISPALDPYEFHGHDQSYRTFNYVRGECRKLARQLRAIEKAELATTEPE